MNNNLTTNTSRLALISIGFKEIPHFTITNGLIYDLGRNRQLSISCLGTPNEMIFICEIDSEDCKKITDLVCLKNYDYDGYTSVDNIKLLITLITGRIF